MAEPSLTLAQGGIILALTGFAWRERRQRGDRARRRRAEGNEAHDRMEAQVTDIVPGEVVA